MAGNADGARELELPTVADAEDPARAWASAETSEASGAKADAAPELDQQPPRRVVLLIMISIIQGYTLVGPLQHAFKVALNIADTGRVAHVFTQAVAFVQWGKFAMTFCQNFVLSMLTPLQRVYLAMAIMFVGCLIVPLFAYAVATPWIGVVFIAYGMLGLSLGIFECTFLNVITPLGPLTKSWAIMGFPAAFAIINVIGMGLVSFGMPVHVLFCYIVCAVPVGMALFRALVATSPLSSEGAAAARPAGNEDCGEAEKRKTAAASGGQATFSRSIRDWRTWLVRLVPFMLANTVGHFVMEGALPANFNAYNAKMVPLLGPHDNMHLMEKHRFFVVFFVFVGLGDMLSRRVGYCFRLQSYRSNLAALLFGLVCCVVGMRLTTLGIAWVGWVSAFLAFWGQGFNYAVASKYIDKFVPEEHNLAAYSFWIFAGGAGGIAGSTMVDVIRSWICHGETYQYECLEHLHH